MNIGMKAALAAAISMAGLGLGTVGASALPLSGLDPAVVTGADTALKADNVRWVCGPYGRCRFVPNRYYGPRPFYGPRAFYGPRRVYRPYGYYGRRW